MDEFGVFTEKYGLKPQGKSAPMAESRRSANAQAQNFGINSSLNSKSSSTSTSNSNSTYGSYLDGLNGPFQSSGKSHSFGSLNSDLFGTSNTTVKQSNGSDNFDYDSYFMGSSNSHSGYVDDIFGEMSEMNFSVLSKKEGVYSSTSSSPAKSDDPFEDLLTNGKHRNSKRFNRNGSDGMPGTKNTVGVDVLLAGFGGISTSNGFNNNTNGTQRSTSHSTYTTNMSSEDPFLMFERSSAPGFTSAFPLDTLEQFTKSSNAASTSVSNSNLSSVLRPPPKPTEKIKQVNRSAASSVDELEKFAVAHVHSNAVKSSQGGNRANLKNSTTKINKEAGASDKGNQPNGEYDFESFFSVSSRSSSLPKTRAPYSEGDTKKLNRTSSGEAHKAPSGFSENMKSSASLDDLSFIFGGSPSIGAFEEVEGDTQERRKARLQRHKMTQARMAKALADMNQRDFQSQQEQQERARISEIVDADIKHWSAGKEGNMRALLSTLQYVLWPECGWQPVSLTDVITSTSVKKVYKKATLCVHPDKVQQKGATLTQRYTAEKVFDILKEAWTKFSKEELS